MLQVRGLLKSYRNINQLLLRNFTEASPGNSVVYSYYKESEYSEIGKKPEWRRPFSKKLQKVKLREDFDRFKKDLKKKARRELGYDQEEEVEVDELFGENPPQVRKYDQVLTKELFYYPFTEKRYETINRKIQYLQHFQPPFTVHQEQFMTITQQIEEYTQQQLGCHIQLVTDPNFNADEFYQTHQVTQQLFNELKNIMQHIPWNQYPGIALKLGHELKYKQDFAGIWQFIEDQLFLVLHQVPALDIIKINYGMTSHYPKAGSSRLRKAFCELIKTEISTMTTDNILHTYQSFRLSNNLNLHFKLVEELIKRKNEIISNGPDYTVNVIYTYANCRPKKYQRKVLREANEEIHEARKVLDTFFEYIYTNLNKLETESLVRLVLSHNIIRLNDYPDLIQKLEKLILPKISELDTYQAFHILYSFSKFNQGLSGGTQEIYQQFLQVVVRDWEQYNNLEKSKILYAYATRKLLNEKLQKELLYPWLNNTISELNYAEIYNVAWILLFINCQDKAIWKQFVHNISNQQQVCPLIFYLPLKLVRYQLQYQYPNWNFSYYKDNCFEAERYFSLLNQKPIIESSQFLDFLKVLLHGMKSSLLVDYHFDNLYKIDLALPQQKVGVFALTDRDFISGTNLIRPQVDVKKRILEFYKWDLLILEYSEFMKIDRNSRSEWFKTQLENILSKTEQKLKEQYETEQTDIVERIFHRNLSFLTNKQKEQAEEEILEEMQNDNIQDDDIPNNKS